MTEEPKSPRSSEHLPAQGSSGYFHGGAPGLTRGDRLISAARLHLHYRYKRGNDSYDPGWTYITTDVGVARAYAARFVARDGSTGGGWLYRVEPDGSTEPDPHYQLAFPEQFSRCREAVVVEVLEEDIHLVACR